MVYPVSSHVTDAAGLRQCYNKLHWLKTMLQIVLSDQIYNIKQLKTHYRNWGWSRRRNWLLKNQLSIKFKVAALTYKIRST